MKDRHLVIDLDRRVNVGGTGVPPVNHVQDARATFCRNPAVLVRTEVSTGSDSDRVVRYAGVHVRT